MKSSGYRSIFHIYLIFFLSLFGALTAAVILSFLLFPCKSRMALL